MDRDRELLAWAMEIVREAQEARTYGEVVVKLEAGTVVRVERREGFKPPSNGGG